MGIYIKGMEMPHYCVNCQFEYCGTCMVNGKNVEEFEYTHSKITKDPGCPLVPVPPHGRLGDLDRLVRMFVCSANARIINGLNVAEQIVKNAPTVIPAEERRE